MMTHLYARDATAIRVNASPMILHMIIGNENGNSEILHEPCRNRSEELRYAVDGFAIRTGRVRYTSCGQGIDWGEGINYSTRGYATSEEAAAELATKYAILDDRRKTGEEKWGNRGANDTAYVIRNGEVHGVRLGGRGDLMSAQGYGVMAHWDASWPELFDSQEAAQRAIEHIREKCTHTWRWLSHEERECSKCGAVEFIPDID